MSLFQQLDSLILSQDSSCSTPAAVLADKGCPTVSIAVIDRGKISTHCISSVGDTEASVFQACNISIPIAGMAAMRLVHEGRLHLDASICEYLDEAQLQLIETRGTKTLLPQVTIKHLLSHTSGLRVQNFRGYGKSASEPRMQHILSGSTPANNPQISLAGLPGQLFSYSEGGITVLQLIMENVCGQAFSELVQDLLFAPLGMKSSFYDPPESRGRHFAKAYYTGYTPCEEPYRVHVEHAAGGLWSTPSDIAKVVRALQLSLRARDSTPLFLEQNLAQEMVTEISPGMGLAWFAPEYPGTGFAHAGYNGAGWSGFVSGFAELGFSHEYNGQNGNVEEECGICVMTNSGLGEDVYRKITAAVAYLKGWPSLPTYYRLKDVFIPFADSSQTVPKRWENWRGSWADGWVVEEDDGGEPCIRWGALPAVPLLVAAVPSITTPEGRSIDLVLEGLDMAVHLTWVDATEVLVVWHGATGKNFLLHRHEQRDNNGADAEGGTLGPDVMFVMR